VNAKTSTALLIFFVAAGCGDRAREAREANERADREQREVNRQAQAEYRQKVADIDRRMEQVLPRHRLEEAERIANGGK